MEKELQEPRGRESSGAFVLSEKHIVFFLLGAVTFFALLISARSDKQSVRQVSKKPELQSAIQPPPTGGSVDQPGEAQPEKKSCYVPVPADYYIRPVSSGWIVRGEGVFDGRYHKGVDFGVDEGSDVFAAAEGEVYVSRYSEDYGYMVVIQHPIGTQTRYAHLSQIFVEVGDIVYQGQTIALSGNTGRSSGPHLHWEVMCGSNPYSK